MSDNSDECRSRRYIPITTTTSSSSSSSANGKTIPQNPTSFIKLSKTLPDPNPPNSGPPAVTCPVPSCSLSFKGERPHGYLWRHLKRPGIHRRTGNERVEWLRLHKVERDRLVATGTTPAQRRHEANRVRAQKTSRAARFASRVRNMGITEETLVAQKVMIWEGMHAAEESGDSIGHDGWVFLDIWTTLLANVLDGPELP